MLQGRWLQGRDARWSGRFRGKGRGVMVLSLKLEVGFSSSSCGTSDASTVFVTV